MSSYGTARSRRSRRALSGSPAFSVRFERAATDEPAMTVGGTAAKTALMLGVVGIAAAVAYPQAPTANPAALIGVSLAALAVAVVTIFKPKLAPYTGTLYTVLQGVVVGVISAMYNATYGGIVVQAALLTGALLAVMLTLYATGTIKVTGRLRRGIIVATVAVLLVYLVSIVARLFGVTVPMIHESGPVGIGFSLVVLGIATANLLLDFDIIERGVAHRSKKIYEWYGAFGLIVTLVWIYLEALRLLGKLRN